MFNNRSKNAKKTNVPSNVREIEYNAHSINKDLMKSIITHGLMFIIILGLGFMQNRKKFISIVGRGTIQQYHGTKEIKGNKSNIKQSSANNNQPIIQASLIDHKMVDEAIKMQEHQNAERILKEKNLQQQEQKLAKLTKTLEQEVLKAQKDREHLKKEQEILQKEVIKFQNQSKELLQQQEKLKKKALSTQISKKNK